MCALEILILQNHKDSSLGDRGLQEFLHGLTSALRGAEAPAMDASGPCRAAAGEGHLCLACNIECCEVVARLEQRHGTQIAV